MASRNLEYDSSNIDFDTAAAIVGREIKNNSSFQTETTGSKAQGGITVKSSMNVGNIIRLDGATRVELKGMEQVIDAVQEALDSQANESGRKAPRGGTPDPNLGGTSPNDPRNQPGEPPGAPQPGDSMDDNREWYIVVDEDFSMEVVPGDNGSEPVTRREQAVDGPYSSKATATEFMKDYREAYQFKIAEDLKPVLNKRFWVHADDPEALVDVLTIDGTRGKAEMPLGLAQEAERFGYTVIVEERAPETGNDPMTVSPNYVRPRHYEEWPEIFNHLQQHPGDEPEVPSPMDRERVPQSQADREGRLQVAQYDNPQAVAEIYENGVVSINRDGNVDTMDTSVGLFIDRDDNSIALGYVGEDLNLMGNDVNEILDAIEQFLRNTQR